MKTFQSMACILTLLVAVPALAAERDGEWITFLSHRSGNNLLYRMRPDGSQLSLVFGGEMKDVPGLSEGLTLYREPHWARQSPDRRFFLDWASDVGFPRERYQSPAHYMLYLGRLDGGPVRILSPDAAESFAWSPDSLSIALSVPSIRQIDVHDVGGLESRVPSTRIVIMRRDGSNEETVLEKPGHWNVLDWSRDGKELLLGYLSGSSLAYSSASLFTFDLTAAGETMKVASERDPTFALFYRSSQQIDAHLKLLTGSIQASEGRYSPDGKQIALIYERERDPYSPRFELGLMKTDDLKLKPLHRAAGLRGPICWSLDGKEVLFSRWLDAKDDDKERMEGEHGLGIYAIQIDDGKVRLVTTGWNPDWR